MYFEAVMREIIKLSADIVVIHEAGANVARQAGVISGMVQRTVRRTGFITRGVSLAGMPRPFQAGLRGAAPRRKLLF